MLLLSTEWWRALSFIVVANLVNSSNHSSKLATGNVALTEKCDLWTDNNMMTTKNLAARHTV